MELLRGIKNIIFDFGGVVINIDILKTREKFIRLGVEDFDNLFSQTQQTKLFDYFETGKISEDQFFSELNKIFGKDINKEELINAWNAMLLDFPEENLKFLEELKPRYRTYLLSNTNKTHLKYYFKKLKEWYGIDNMDSLFEKTYYSCNVGMRKPNNDIFQFVLEENDLVPEETLFIDDTNQHIIGATAAGIRAYHLKSPETIRDILT